jgi:protein SCO1/2
VALTRRRLATAAALALAGCGRRSGEGAPASFHATDVTGADFGRRLALPDLDGRMRTLDDFKGKVTVLFFGYTQCPDVCPTTLAELAQVKKALGAEGDRLQGVFVTLDPERDTPEVLRSYVASFDPGFVALRGNAEQTAAAAKEFKVFYAKVPGKSPGSYTLDHTAASFVFDPSGRLRLFVRYGSGAVALADDVRALLKGAA